jgi:hypothetical protein
VSVLSTCPVLPGDVVLSWAIVADRDGWSRVAASHWYHAALCGGHILFVVLGFDAFLVVY